MTGVPDFGSNELVPTVVQDVSTGQVLMVAYMNEVAFRTSSETGYAHFWSRSRQKLWKKGATSGNVMRIVNISLDCDDDAILLTVKPAGPACHTGTVSCFGQERTSGDEHADRVPAQGFYSLESLWATIAERANHLPEGSYTADLIAGGVEATARKVLEEAAEVAFAAKNHAFGSDSDGRVASEAADVIYHLLVLLAERRVNPRLVIEELAARAPRADS
ncbi:MAG: bifunctional phosphoribosyl-AMP cyclohydrolase/phosphoribosyl-ATP diphosphatase HisIE [Acidimicrobiia bacterium]|nr:bifunctional phosphoribosyl-AMP cyclohydrolase/phosphoribosyl-ATP diphosphatase HisIE [Acidimicrobiia bacterium]